MSKALFLILSCIVVANTARKLLTGDGLWVNNDQFEIGQSSDPDSLLRESSEGRDLPQSIPINYDTIPTALAFAMKQERGTGKATDIPPELMQKIAEFIPINPLSELQQEIMKILQFYIEAKLKTGHWNGMLLVIEYLPERTKIYICRGECCHDRMIFDGKMSHLERDCMHQVLLERKANRYLSIQKLPVVGKPELYKYTLDGRGSYLNPAINYCKSEQPALDSYNYNPPILQVVEEVD